MSLFKHLSQWCVICALLWACAITSPAMAADVAPTTDAVADSYKALKAKLKDNPSLMAFEKRLELVEQLSQDLALASAPTAAEPPKPDATVTPDGPKPPATAAAPISAPMTAEALFNRYQDRFIQALPQEGLSAEDLSVLAAYYSQNIRQAEQKIVERVQAIEAANPQDAVRATTLTLVFPMLHVPDEQWSDETMATLPQWVRESASLGKLEDFSLKIQRPLAAFYFATKAQQKTGGAPPLDKQAYFTAAADTMYKQKNVNGALACLELALDVARKSGDDTQLSTMIFHIAEFYGKARKPEKSAELTATLLEDKWPAAIYGKAAMYNLKYLYEAKKYHDVLDASAKFQANEKAKPYQPQILYITWVAARRDGAESLAAQTAKLFLDRFPTHVLGADIYYSNAMEALAQSNYSEASRLLEFIEYRYPESHLIRRVKDIRKKLATLFPATPSSTSKP